MRKQFNYKRAKGDDSKLRRFLFWIIILGISILGIINGLVDFVFACDPVIIRKIAFQWDHILLVINLLFFGISLIVVRCIIPMSEKTLKPIDKSMILEREKAWDYYKHADNLLHNRINLFLVAQSMLIISFATLFPYNGSFTKTSIQTAIILLGAIYSLTWLYVNLRIQRRLDFLTQRYLKNGDVYEEYIEHVGKEGFIASQTEFIPICTIIFCFFLLIITWLSHYNWVALIITSIIILTWTRIREKIPTKI